MKAIKVILGIVAIAAAVYFGALVATSPSDNLVIEDATIVTAQTGDRTANGVVRNTTDVPYSNLQIVAEFLDYDGNVVGVATSTLGTIPPQASLTFEFPVEQEAATSIRARAVSPDNVRPDWLGGTRRP